MQEQKSLRKQIIFNVSAEDHAIIKEEAHKSRMPMRQWIILAMANEIKRNQEEIK